MNPSDQTSPNYPELVHLLVAPLLEHPEALKIDSEINQAKARIWIRVAFEGSDKGRVFGRGGRTIQAIRTTIEAAAQAAGQMAYLEIYGTREETERSPEIKKAPPKRRPSPRAE